MLGISPSNKGTDKWLGLIPARAGSKGLQRKNVKVFHGKPLIYWTITSAIESGIFSDVAVTTNDLEVKEIAFSLGVSVLDRPESLAGDESLASDYLRYHAPKILQFENVMLLQATSPLRTSIDIRKCEEILICSNTNDSVIVSVSDALVRPRNIFVFNQNNQFVPLLETKESNRQSQETIYRVNGAIFATRTNTLIKLDYDFLAGTVIPYMMPTSRSVDIDNLEDFQLAEKLFLREVHKNDA